MTKAHPLQGTVVVGTKGRMRWLNVCAIRHQLLQPDFVFGCLAS